jgi:hypothetical protein
LWPCGGQLVFIIRHIFIFVNAETELFAIFFALLTENTQRIFEKTPVLWYILNVTKQGTSR